MLSNRLNRATLRVEALETRECPAAWAHLADHGHTLVVGGTEAADGVGVAQDDRAGTLTVTGVAGGRAVFRSAGITAVQVDLLGGDDRFEYVTAGDVRTAKQLRVALGGGDDTAFLLWAEDGGEARADLTAVVSGGAGSDAVKIRVGRLAAGVSATVHADLGAGGDAAYVQALAPSRAAARLYVWARGGEGRDELIASVTGELHARASAGFDLSGEAGDDRLTTEVAGRVHGMLSARADGGAGDDTLTTTTLRASGPGRVLAGVFGGRGDDGMSLVAGPRTIDWADGGGGTDALLTTGGAAVWGVEQVQPASDADRLVNPPAPFDPVLPTATLTHAGRAVEYWTAGRSAPGEPVVVLLAGAGDTLDTWVPVARQLARGSQVIAVNRPGFGRSSPLANYTGAAVVETVRAAVRRLAGDRPVLLVGHSFGGLYANLYARLHPTEVAGVVFDDASPPEQFQLAEEAGLPNGGLRDPADPLLRLYPPGPRSEERALGRISEEAMRARAFPAVPAVSLTTLSPEQVDQLPPEFAAMHRRLAALGSPASGRYVPGAGHYIHADQPGAVLSAVADVLRLAGESRRLRATLEVVRQEAGLPALAGGVIRDGQVVAVAAAGVREQGRPTPVTAADQFHLGSNGKAMTATLAAVLVERGLVRWDTTLAEAFPELRGRIDAAYAGVTLEQLLNHRGRLVDESIDPGLIERIVAYRGPEAPGRRLFLGELLATPPGPAGGFSYSNAGYTVAGALLERAAGGTFERLMRKHLFEPLGMTSAGFGPPGRGRGRLGQPRGHGPEGTSVGNGREADNPALANPAGRMHMDMADWAKFLRVHLGERVNGVRLLSDASLRKLHTPDPGPVGPDGERYGFGWVSLDTPLGRVLSHNGSNEFWYSEAVLLLDRKVALFAVTNQAGGAAEAAVQAVLAAELSRVG